jgi:hypothetical protein
MKSDMASDRKKGVVLCFLRVLCLVRINMAVLFPKTPRIEHTIAELKILSAIYI